MKKPLKPLKDDRNKIPELRKQMLDAYEMLKYRYRNLAAEYIRQGNDTEARRTLERIESLADVIGGRK